MSTRRQRFDSPVKRTLDIVLRYLSRPLKRLSPNLRFYIFFGLLVLVVTVLLGSQYSLALPENYKLGDIVKVTTIAPADINGITDIDETERRRSAAMDSTTLIFAYDTSKSEHAAQSFRLAWDDLDQQIKGRVRAPEWKGKGGEPVKRTLVAHHMDGVLLERLVQFLRETEDGYIYEDVNVGLLRQEIVLINNNNRSERMLVPMPLSRMTALSLAQRSMASRIAQLSGLSQEQGAALATATVPLIEANVFYDQAATLAARLSAAEKVAPITLSLKRNQVVAREGDTVTEPMLAQLAAVRSYGNTARPRHRIIGLLFIVTALFWATWKFTEHRTARGSIRLSDKKAFALISSAILVETLLMRLGFIVSDSIARESTRAPFNDPAIWNFAIPFAAAALLIAMLVDTHVALITAVITTLFAGLLAPGGVSKGFYVFISCSAAIYGIGRYRERQSVTLAGLIVGVTNGLMAVAVIAYAQQPMPLNTILFASGCGMVGGLLTTIFTAGGLPINESFFSILTDVKLLELSNADLPVLGQLALRAPGTNQHSHAVGQLAEDACRAVGANPLLARIGALYHDIGKLAAPAYFVENQHGHNPHDRLRPSQSARIITSHVNYGLKLAGEIGLPTQIADFIPQHHGTRTLHFFLRKAQAEASNGEHVNDREFRYPGPKPQFKETAILMLADSCEAAARSLARPDPDNIREIVTKIVDAIISDGQLDECDITLRELTIIREAMITALTAIYHARIDYPGFNPSPLTGALPQALLDNEEHGVLYNKASEVPINKAGEVEDEAVTRRD